MAEFVKVATTQDVPEGGGVVVEAGTVSLALFKINGTVHAVNNVCLHQGGPLGEGDLQGTVVTCPWHGWQFDVTTGLSPVNPSAHIDCYEVKMEGEDVLVNIPV